MAQIFVPASLRPGSVQRITFTGHWRGHLRCNGAALFRFGALTHSRMQATIAKPH